MQGRMVEIYGPDAFGKISRLLKIAGCQKPLRKKLNQTTHKII